MDTPPQEIARRPTPHPTVVLREEFDDWAVLYNPDTGDAMGVNPTGVILWKAMDGRRTLADLVRSLAAHFAELPAEADAQVAAFVDTLAARGFVGFAA